MTYLLDTSTFSDIVRRHPATSRNLQAASEDTVIVCSVVKGEILHGVNRLPEGRRKKDLEARLAALFAEIDCEPIPEAAADHYAIIRTDCELRGIAITDNDAWIAATALSLGATLVTRDQDYSRIAGLATTDWSRPDTA